MIKFDIKNAHTSETKFTAEIECAEDASRASKLRLAVEWAIKNEADLSRAYLSRSDLREADLSGANLSGANLSGANLSGAELSETDLSGASLYRAHLNEANLIGANLIGANLIGADLSRANLIGANLSGANLSGANLSDADLSGAPKIENIHQKVYEAVEGGNSLDMGNWHNNCGTKHCRAGWVVALAGKEGKELETKIGTSAAACAIYLASDPEIKSFPDFHCSDEEAMKDIIACAEREKK
jgi:uncharacterized protein YjbI with pentapeptide repeats